MSGRKGRKCVGSVKVVVLGVALGFLLASSAHAAPATCANGRSANGAMWFSFAHPGLGEYFLNGWGNWNRNMPQKKFWLGFIPFYGWPGYLQVKSMVDARNCRTTDSLNWGQ